jgi:hypothetical protein
MLFLQIQEILLLLQLLPLQSPLQKRPRMQLSPQPVEQYIVIII